MMKSLYSKLFDVSVWALIISFFMVVHINFNYKHWKGEKSVIVNEIKSYYGYLPAAFIYDDIGLEFTRDNMELRRKFWRTETPIGKFVLRTSGGMAMLFLPFFIAAHSVAELVGYEADGYTLPYRLALVISSMFYLMLGAIFLRKFLLKYFSKPVVAITILATILATNLMWYVTFEAAMSHTYSFALISIFIFVIDNWYSKQSLRNTIFIGLLVGIISLIRPVNIIIVILLILWKVTTWEGIKTRIVFLINKWPLIILMIVMFTIVWMPQFIYWKYVSGSFLYYSYPKNQGFFFSNPQLFNTILSWRKGFFIYTPVMIFAVMGVGLLYKNKKEFFWPVVVYILFAWYITSCWWSWWYGGSLGLRPFIDSYGVLAIGLATFLTWLSSSSNFKKTIFITLFILTAALGGWHTAKYRGGSIHWVAMTKEAYFESFWDKRPTGKWHEKIRYPDSKLAKEGIYKYADESEEDNAK
ncbi:MAG: hypothetical protein QM487_09210 [Candidatus Marithrix sp.]